MPRETVKYFHIFYTIPQFPKVQAANAQRRNPPLIFFRTQTNFSRRLDISVMVTSLLFLCRFVITHKNRCEFRSTIGK